ncbi:hypothetical protein SESBI_26213 [Sesbania bispinosa]|nr:hypothetical protein SESBI_26213 [Sesbania bispinosa]
MLHEPCKKNSKKSTPNDLINECLNLNGEDSSLEPEGKETEAFSHGSKSNINNGKVSLLGFH